jgi:hypothetical protein
MQAKQAKNLGPYSAVKEITGLSVVEEIEGPVWVLCLQQVTGSPDLRGSKGDGPPAGAVS